MSDVQLICGDCLDVLPTLADGSVDCVVTDPPYGLGIDYGGYEDTLANLRNLISGFIPEVLRIARKRVIVLPGVTQIIEYPKPDWVGAIVWPTTGTYGKYGVTQWMPMLFYGKDVDGFGSVNGVIKSDTIRITGGDGIGFLMSSIERQHPCPKNTKLMELVIRRFIEPHSHILDPLWELAPPALRQSKNSTPSLALKSTINTMPLPSAESRTPPRKLTCFEKG